MRHGESEVEVCDVGRITDTSLMTFLLLAFDAKPTLLMQLVLGARKISDLLRLRFLAL